MTLLATPVEPFAVHRQDAGRVPVFVVHGALDQVAAAQLSAAVCAFGGHDVVVDLRDAQLVEPGAERDLLLAARVLAVRLRML
jgi:hypothetical protein